MNNIVSKIAKGVFGVVLIAAVTVMSFEGAYNNVRWAGTNTQSGGQYYQCVDSSDTFQVDTFYSDTIDIGDYKWINAMLALTGFTLADSCNDSVWIKVQARGSYNGLADRELARDSFTAHTLDSTEELYMYINADSFAVNKLHFQTIISDSFIAGENQTGNDDSSSFRFQYIATQIHHRKTDR